MQEAARRRLGAGLDGMTVAVQGLGNVGSALCALLHDAGARLIVAEPRPGVAAAVALRYGAEIMGRESILDARCDIFAPCALGGVIDRDGIRGSEERRVGNECVSTCSSRWSPYQ